MGFIHGIFVGLMIGAPIGVVAISVFILVKRSESKAGHHEIK